MWPIKLCTWPPEQLLSGGHLIVQRTLDTLPKPHGALSGLLLAGTAAPAGPSPLWYRPAHRPPELHTLLLWRNACACFISPPPRLFAVHVKVRSMAYRSGAQQATDGHSNQDNLRSVYSGYLPREVGKVLESHRGEQRPQRLVKVELYPLSWRGRTGKLEGESHLERMLKRSQDLQPRDEVPAPGNLAGRGARSLEIASVGVPLAKLKWKPEGAGATDMVHGSASRTRSRQERWKGQNLRYPCTRIS